ncbi:MAG: RagB/SusD family nutrient uptake outer membrane protein [Bacteroidales bacterium]|nr:RagB/SusD family nutrient uptake outer membrane protein [Bacteroidales bacterium]
MKKITLIFGMLALLLTQTSCSSDFLDTSSSTDLSETVLLSTFDGLMMAMNGVHRKMAGTSTGNQTATNMWPGMAGSQGYGGLYSHGIVIDHMGDDLVIRHQGNSWHHSAMDWSQHRNYANANTLRTYSFFFSIVGQMNMILAYIDDVVATEHQRNMIRGQALAYRSFAYWWLVQLWGERYVRGQANDAPAVPLVIERITAPQPRASVQEIYDQINADLLLAIGYLTNNPVSAALSRSHISANVAHGFKARVALTQQNWDVAAHHARLARVDGDGFRLATAAELLNGLYDHRHPEFMWAMHQPPDQGPVQASFSGYMSINYAGTFIRTSLRGITTTLYNGMDPNDIRRDWWVSDPNDPIYDIIRTPAPIGNGTRIERYAVRKWRMNGVWTVPDTRESVDPAFMRISEMYLIEAEAEFEAGREANARAVLTTLMEIRVPGFTTTNTGQALRDEIRTNRRIELWGEGFRWLDLKRHGEGMTRSSVGFGGLYDADGDPVDPLFTGGLLDVHVPADDPRWLWQVPRREILASHGLITQNR